ncbi:MAG: 30S ribosomal protein S17, partial [Rhodopirellula sp.]|nr:30S ribosomal protein S17 [Rhodopirellula sp.]
SNKMDMTIVVQVNRKVRHPLYEKFVSKRSKLYAHDEKSEANVGDIVEITQTRPLSKLKRWRLVRVLEKSTEVDVAALRAARKGATQAESEAIEAAHAGDEAGETSEETAGE